MVFAQERFQDESGVFQRVVEIHNLKAILEVDLPHFTQPSRPVDQKDDFADAAHAAAQRFPAEHRAKFTNRLKAWRGRWLIASLG